jgi:hypothetical protein
MHRQPGTCLTNATVRNICQIWNRFLLYPLLNMELFYSSSNKHWHYILNFIYYLLKSMECGAERFQLHSLCSFSCSKQATFPKMRHGKADDTNLQISHA